MIPSLEDFRRVAAERDRLQKELKTANAAFEIQEAKAIRLKEVNAELLKALKEIEKGAGRYSMDPLEHAANCIEDMQDVARAAIAKAEGGK